MDSLFSLLVVVLTLQGFVRKADAAVSITSADTASVAEDLAEGSVIKELVATGAAAGTTITFTITGSTPAGLQPWFHINGSNLVVAAGQTLDHEESTLAAGGTVTVALSATDGSTTGTQSLTVTITDVDEPPAFSAHGFGSYVASPIAATSAVVTILGTDPEGATVTHAITAGDGGKVEIASATGAITTKTGQTLTNCYLALTVTVSDATNNVATAGVAVCVGRCTDNCDGSSGSVPGSILALLVAAVLAALKL